MLALLDQDLADLMIEVPIEWEQMLIKVRHAAGVIRYAKVPLK